jgi:hypothetical protein
LDSRHGTHERNVRFRLTPMTGSTVVPVRLVADATSPFWTQSSWRRSQLRQPFGRSSHLTWWNVSLLSREPVAHNEVAMSPQLMLRFESTHKRQQNKKERKLHHTFLARQVVHATHPISPIPSSNDVCIQIPLTGLRRCFLAAGSRPALSGDSAITVAGRLS